MLGQGRSLRSQRLNCGPGDLCCVSAGLNIRPMFGCGSEWGILTALTLSPLHCDSELPVLSLQ